jgi:hypothetical protein
MKQYEDENKDTLDILFGFVDFEKFKKMMLDFKDAHRNDVDVREEANQTGAEFTWESFTAMINEDIKSKPWKKKVETSEKLFA